MDTQDIGAPTHAEFRNLRGHVRAEVKLGEAVLEEYGGGFIGLLRPQLYERMLAAYPALRLLLRRLRRISSVTVPAYHRFIPPQS